MSTKISAISGFPEYLPAQQLAFNSIVSKIKAVYESFGYVPLETPAVERIDTLTSKGIDAKEVYALRRLNAEGEDSSAKELALKFDLTVPLARYVSQHYASLVFPFRRYQVQPVWRGERAQKGRYRQFYQFDIDYIADGPLPHYADAEIIGAAYKALKELGLNFRMHINNRKLLLALLDYFGFGNHQKEALKVIDDADKIGVNTAINLLAEFSSKEQAVAFVNFVTTQNTAIEIDQLALSHAGKEGADELWKVLNQLQEIVGEDAFFDNSIMVNLIVARGLDYYTGTVMETQLLDEKGNVVNELGSICSGGRYENLAESLSDRKLPGVGISIGISRLFDWLKTQPQYADTAASTAHVLIPLANEAELPAATKAAAQLRAAGVHVEQSLTPQPLGTQLQKAEKRGLKYAVLPAPDGTLTLRTFATREDQKGLTPAQVASKLLK